VTGIAAAALALTACGIAAGSSGGTSAGHAAVSAGHAPASTWVIQQEEIAQVKRHIVWIGGNSGQAQRLQADLSRVTGQQDFAKVKRDIVLHAGQQARGR
jgi:ABC-type glycerol-3-phosphate transport system substrate-binding protein